MNDFLKLKKEVSETTMDIEPDDVLSVKNKLKGFGYYKEPEWGVTNFSDRQMFDGIRKFQTDNKLKVDGVMKPEGETEATMNKFVKANNGGNLKQVIGSIKDMSRNYWDMKNDNVVGNDDYFHCKANFEAAQRGKIGAETAKYLGDMKERFDYFKNRLKGVSAIDAYADYNHDKYINDLGRQQAKSGLYSSSRKACEFKRKEKTDERY